MVGFCFIRVWCYSEWWVWGLITLAQFQGSEVSPRLYGQVYKTLRLSPLVAEHSVVFMSARLNPMGSQFSIPVSWSLCSESIGRPSWGPRHWRFEFNYCKDGILTCFSILISVMFCTWATFVKKNCCLVTRTASFGAADLHLLINVSYALYRSYLCKEKLLLSYQNSFIWCCRSASTYFPYFRAITVQRYCTWSQSRYVTLGAFKPYLNQCFWVSQLLKYDGFFKAMLWKRLFKIFVWSLSSALAKQWK